MDNCLVKGDQEYLTHRKWMISIYLLCYYTVAIVFTQSGRLFSQSFPAFFSYNRDLSELAIIAAGLPKFMINNTWTFIISDCMFFIFPILIISYYKIKGRFLPLLGWTFLVFIFLFIHLQNIFLLVTPAMYIGLFILGFIFITNKEDVFYKIVAIGRYYFLYTMFTAAIWKIFRGAIFNYEIMSNILVFQHGNVLYDNCTTWYCNLYFYLIDHTYFSYSLYIFAVILEALFVIGFFSKKYNKLLFIITCVFFLFNTVIMRIPFWPFLLLGSTLLINDRKRTPSNLFSYKEWQKINLKVIK